MKVVMVNDAAFVGQTLLKYLPNDVEKQHIKRTRGLWSKTFGLAWRILRAKGDVYHANYLLQDCYIASRLGKRPLVGSAMGSDLRQQLGSKKWGWIVRHNLRSCDKILVVQPTLLDVAKNFNSTAEYLPIPFDPEIFFPKPLPTSELEEKRVFIASAHDFKIKGTDKFLRALASVPNPIRITSISSGKDFGRARRLAEELGLKVNFIGPVPHDKMNELYWESDLVLGSFGVGQLDTVAIEAMACGRPVVHSVSKRFFQECPLEELKGRDEATGVISKALTDVDWQDKRVKDQLLYVDSRHSAPLLAERLMKIYSELQDTSR
ncbi:MAG: glycosyltransferase [Candidatus Bathyarchaeia archaeon]